MLLPLLAALFAAAPATPASTKAFPFPDRDAHAENGLQVVFVRTTRRAWSPTTR